MSETNELGPKEIRVTVSRPGYAHTKLEGICGPSVTVQDIAKEVFHPYFGGRNVHLHNGKWSAIRHDD